MFPSRIRRSEKEFQVFNRIIRRTHGKSLQNPHTYTLTYENPHSLWAIDPVITSYLGREWSRVFHPCRNESSYFKPFVEFLLCNVKSQTRKN